MGFVSLSEVPEGSLGPSATRRQQKKEGVLEPKSGPHQTPKSTGAMILDFPESRTVKNKFLFFTATSLQCYVIAAQTD